MRNFYWQVGAMLIAVCTFLVALACTGTPRPSLSIVSGNEQIAAAGAMSAPLVVQVAHPGNDATGKPAAVVFTIISGGTGTQTIPVSKTGTASATFVISAAPGVATKIQASYYHAASVLFTLTTAQPATGTYSLQLWSGGGQTLNASETSAPIILRAYDINTPTDGVPGVVINFSSPIGTGPQAPGTTWATSTDADGFATTALVVNANATAGPFASAVTATASGAYETTGTLLVAASVSAAQQMELTLSAPQCGLEGGTTPLTMTVANDMQPYPSLYLYSIPAGSAIIAPIADPGDPIGPLVWDYPYNVTLGATAGDNFFFATATPLSGFTLDAINTNAGPGGGILLTSATSVGAASDISVSGGNGQTFLIGTALPTPLSVIVTDACGNAVTTGNVTFTVSPSDGIISAPSAPLDGSGGGTPGTATTMLTLGATPGPYTVTAAIGGLQTTFTETATALGPAGTPAFLTIVGDSIGSTSNPTVLLTVEVTDASAVAVPGVTTQWVASSGSLGAPQNLITDASGDATTTLTLPPLEGEEYAVVATVSVTIPSAATIAPVVFSEVDDTLVIATDFGDNQFGQPDTALPLTVGAEVESADNPVSNFTVTFTVTSGDATFSNDSQTISVGPSAYPAVTLTLHTESATVSAAIVGDNQLTSAVFTESVLLANSELVNPGFETSGLFSWTANGVGSAMASTSFYEGAPGGHSAELILPHGDATDEAETLAQCVALSPGIYCFDALVLAYSTETCGTGTDYPGLPNVNFTLTPNSAPDCSGTDAMPTTIPFSSGVSQLGWRAPAPTSFNVPAGNASANIAVTVDCANTSGSPSPYPTDVYFDDFALANGACP